MCYIPQLFVNEWWQTSLENIEENLDSDKTENEVMYGQDSYSGKIN